MCLDLKQSPNNCNQNTIACFKASWYKMPHCFHAYKSCLNTCRCTRSLFFFPPSHWSPLFLTNPIHSLHSVIWRKINRIFGSSSKLWDCVSCGSAAATAAAVTVICRHFTAAGAAIWVKLWGYWLQKESSFTESSRARPETGWERRVLPLY